jgi:hypothetical protein
VKTIDLATNGLTLKKLLLLAGEENVVLRTVEGRSFVLAEIDDFAEEVARTARNKPLMALLGERSKEADTHTLNDVRKKLKRK